MTATRITITLLGLAAALAAPVPAEKSSERLGNDVVPTREAVRLVVDPERTDYEGTVTIALDVRTAADAFRLHAEGLEPTRVSLAAGGADRGVTWEREADDVLRIVPDAPLSPGPATLEIDFEADFGTKAVGLYRTVVDGDGYVFTQFEADDAREAFPCFDEPSFKIPWDVALVVPEGQVAVANMPVASESVEAGRRTIVYRRTPPLPSYLLVVAVGPFETVDVPGMSVPGRIVAPKGQGGLTGFAVRVTPPILAALERWFDRPHPFPKLDLVAVPEFWAGAMENPGAITYKDRVLLLDPDRASVGLRRTHVEFTAHELAHQWFGNLVTMKWWDDLWLNEAFADWMAGKITEEIHPEFRLRMTDLQRAQGQLGMDARPSTKPIRRPIESTEQLMEGVQLTYAKGRMVLGMFEGWMGAETFRRGVLDYLDEHAWGNAEAADLWRALDAASGSDVSGAMAGFLEQPGFPLVRVEPLGDGRVRLSQSRFHNQGVDVPDMAWRVPMVLRWSDGTTAHRRGVLLEGESMEVRLQDGAPAWVLPNGGGTGYYRWWMPPESIAKLARVSATELAPEERAELLGDLGALLDAGEVDGATYVRALGEFRDDPDPLVLTSVAAGVATIQGVFVTPELEPDFAAWVRATLGPGLERVGRTPRPDEAEAVSLVRPTLLATLAEWGRDLEVRAWCRDQAAAYLDDPGAVDPSVAATVLRIAAIYGDREVFDTLRRRYETAESAAEAQRFLGAVCSVRDPELAGEMLAWALSTLRPDQLGTLWGSVSATEAGRQRFFEFVRANYDELADRLPQPFVAMLPYSGGGCSPQRLAAAQEFFQAPERAVQGTEAALARVGDQVRDCVSLREREGDAVAAELGRFAAGLSAARP